MIRRFLLLALFLICSVVASPALDLPAAIQKARPGSQWTCGETYESLVWRDAVQTKPTLQELETAWDAVLTERAVKLADDAARLLKKECVGGSVATLRTWAQDAQTATGNWDGWTQTQKNAAMKTMMTRFGVMCDRMADLIEAQRLDE
jgi:hypothetical protein